jgi:uncharacterized protein (DUF3820 family)
MLKMGMERFSWRELSFRATRCRYAVKLSDNALNYIAHQGFPAGKVVQQAGVMHPSTVGYFPNAKPFEPLSNNQVLGCFQNDLAAIIAVTA